jgi:hypothetical protein
MCYLRPPSNDLPLVLFFGDKHQSEDLQCERCDPRQGCYSISDPAFLRRLDRLASEYPVDFYVEAAPDMESEEKGVLFKSFHHTTKGCYRNRERPEYEDLCPTRNLRWHYTDTRFFSHKLEGEIFAPLLGKISLAREDGKTAPLSPGSERGRAILETLFDLISYCIENTLPYESVMDRVADSMVRSINVPGSALYKQRATVDLRQLWKTPYFIRYLNAALHRDLPLRKLISLLLSDEESRVSPREMQLVYELTAALSGRVMDMYQVARMLKMKSSLALGFFGESHVLNLTDFLVYTLGYTVAFENRSAGRCVTIDQRVDLEGDLRTLETHRDAYLEQLSRERTSRDTGREIDPERRYLLRLTPGARDIHSYTLDFQQMLHYVVRSCVQQLFPARAREQEYVIECAYRLLDTVIQEWGQGFFRESRVKVLVIACVASVLERVMEIPNVFHLIEEVLGVERAEVLPLVDAIEELEQCEPLEEEVLVYTQKEESLYE